jgi:hypothetical protein
MSDASAWEATSMQKRPWRTEFFAKFADEIASDALSRESALEVLIRRSRAVGASGMI